MEASKQSGKILVISGPSGCGKGTVIDILFARKIGVKAVSFTTRPMRRGEVEGRDYYFITQDRFQELLASDGILEYTYFNGNYYGTPKDEIDRLLADGKNPILDITYDGAFHVREFYPHAILCFLIPPSAAVQERRLRGRMTQSEESILERLQAAHQELALAEKFDCVIVNEDGCMEKTADQICHLLHGVQPDQSRIPEILNGYFGD